MKIKTGFTFLIIGFSLLVIFCNNPINTLAQNTVLAPEVDIQAAQELDNSTPTCALDQQMNCSVPLLSQVTSQLIGVWKLISYETKNSKGELLTKAPWHFSNGLLMYDQLGNMAVQLVDDSHPKFPSGKFADIVNNQLSPSDLKASVLGYLAYFGTYTVNQEKQTIIHHVKASTNNTSGTDQERGFELQENQLILTKLAGSSKGKKDQLTTRITWQRVGSS